MTSAGYADRPHPRPKGDSQTPSAHASLVDVLDRLLDKGALLQADLIIRVAGVALLGLNLRAALGAVDVLVAYGVFDAEDPFVRTAQTPVSASNSDA